MGTNEQIQKHVYRYKYYRLMKYKMHKKMICEFRTLERMTNEHAKEAIKGQIDEEQGLVGVSYPKSELAKGADFCSPSCKPKNHSE